MSKREKVYLWTVIALSLVTVVAAGAYVFTLNRVDGMRKGLAEAQNQRDRLDEDKKALSDTLTSLKRLIAGDARVDDFPRVEDLRDRDLKSVEAAVNEALKDLGRQVVTFDNLLAPYAEYQRIFQSYRDQRDTAVNNLTGRIEDFMSKLESKDQMIANGKKEFDAKVTELTGVQRKWEDCEGKHTTIVAKLTQDISERDEAISDLKVSIRRQLQQRDNQISSLTTLNRDLQNRMRREETWDQDNPDGSLVEVASSLGKAWIDLGRRDRVMTGLVFRVYQPLKGGKKLYKGKVEVRKVDESFAEVSIVEQASPDRTPIVAGDRIISPFYDKGNKPVFVFAGVGLRTQEMTQDYIKGKLGSYGCDVAADVGINTSFVVALKDYEATPQFTVAQRLGIPVLREEELLEFIGQ